MASGNLESIDKVIIDGVMDESEDLGESSASVKPAPIIEPTVSGGSFDDTNTQTKIGSTPSRSQHSYQSSLESFLPPTPENEKGDIPFALDAIAEKVASEVVRKLNNFGKGKQTAATFNPLSTTSLNAGNLLECLDEIPDFELIGEENSRVLRCCSCAEFLSSPVSSSFRRPSGKAGGSLATGLQLSNDVYDQLVAGKCEKWYHQKERMINHLASKTHSNAVDFMKTVKAGKSREIVVVKNQLRAAIGIVKTKSAAIQYEERIAELQAAGADVGHSRKLFPAMLSAACAYID
ncbi:Hypothetical predicted protein [Paramuricea clavata]|uniref:Uncharacterized protein n=1 Tax=Paramuricea clavata TaxID=317549 RepID=A0A7D9I7S4_PARCT|nr:Hypothetical predicted protein [Paramuricea clavata]